MLRKTSSYDIYGCRMVYASMRPQRNAAENIPDRELAAMNPEASMRPQRNAAENPSTALLVVLFGQASMRPQRNAAENRRYHCRV